MRSLRTAKFSFKTCIFARIRTIKYVQAGVQCHHQAGLSSGTSGETSVQKLLQTRIKAGGPITVAQYMKTVLTASHSGYYMHKDVFGTKGDFTTSPEISQMFGEMLGVWCVNEWTNLCGGQPIQIVELGPGRGTLAQDLLRVFSQFSNLKDKVSMHLVEVSPALSRLQCERLTGIKSSDSSEDSPPQSTSEPGVGPYRRQVTPSGTPVSWYRALEDVPRALSFYVAHEFLDALPVHKFQKTERGWREVMVDLNKDNLFHFVLSPGRTAASTAYLKVSENESRDHIEVCPEAGKTVQEVAERIQQHGGFGLFIDYGHNGEKGDTFRGFKKHELHDALVEPGTADLTADVDFSYLQQCIKGVAKFGPITQQEFLLNMGIGVRLQMLLEKGKKDHWASLLTGYDMLTNPTKMGERFKFLAVMNPEDPGYTPAGFLTPDFLKTQS